ncbi:hypothetical protein AA15669_0070 [Saccharibacter floricola DSM 15669]|uniref:Uncharacterized protein n=1 Tax=Saccharibacter floricola DSM 15669 TaxID=1123227 RepID=A0ABQ0NVX5_9PROT|nr:hypothetical protein AA15669_0070 [Saccharibacter floricola DSM 15669]
MSSAFSAAFLRVVVRRRGLGASSADASTVSTFVMSLAAVFLGRPLGLGGALSICLDV